MITGRLFVAESSTVDVLPLMVLGLDAKGIATEPGLGIFTVR